MSIWPRLFRKKKPERLSSKLKWFSETSWLQLIRRRMQMFQFSSCINSSSRGRNQFIKVSTWCTKKEMQTEMFLKFIKHFAGFHLKITSQSLQIKWWLTIIWRDWISQSWILILLDYKESIYQLLIKPVNSWGSSSKLLTLMEHPHTKRSIQPYSQLSPSHSFSVWCSEISCMESFFLFLPFTFAGRQTLSRRIHTWLHLCIPDTFCFLWEFSQPSVD